MAQQPGYELNERSGAPGSWRRVLAAAAALALTILIGIVVYLVSASNNERDRVSALERDSYETIMLARNIGGSVARADAALGRFIVENDQLLGTHYRNEWRAADRQLTQLERLHRNDADYAERLAQLRTAFDEYGEHLSNSANYAVSNRNWEAISLHYGAWETGHGDRIAETLASIVEFERARLNSRRSERMAATERSNRLNTLMTIAGVILGIAAFILGWTVVQAFRARSTADEKVDRLEDAVARRTAELEQLNAELRAEASERLATEQKLRQAQKMEAVGQLTGGIAHDFNNMLSIIVGGIELAKRKLPEDAPSLRHLDTAGEGAERAADLTRRLLAFSRSEPLLPESTDVSDLVHRMADLMRRALGERIKVRIKADDGAGHVWVDQRQLENAILNMAVNARDAMDGEGEILIGIKNAALGDREVGSLRAGDYLHLSVTDAGSGMDKDVLERVFEPFFTTKGVGKGTGLGLSQIFGFARQSGGDVGIESTVGIGTTVSVYLPLYEGTQDALRSDAASSADRNYGQVLEGARIILVEDDPRVRAATAEALGELGAQTRVCTSGQEALDALAGGTEAQLLLTDIVMPDISGIELAEQVGERHPDMPIVYMTGFVGDTADMENLAGRDILRKPFTMDELAAAVCKALDQHRETGIAAE